MRLILQPSYVLHHRPYRETSLIVDLFTFEHGRIGAVAKGVRQSRSQWRSYLQPFVPILISTHGRGELLNLTTVESQQPAFHFKGECLLSALYLNELLVRLLQKHDPHPGLYTIYHETLLELQTQGLQQRILRIFEKKLLEEIGYGLQLGQSVGRGAPFEPEQLYRYHPEHGFEPSASKGVEPHSSLVFHGASLISLEQESLQDERSLKEVKRLMRLVLQPLLGTYELQTRRLFESIKIE